MSSAIVSISGSRMPRVVTAGVPMRTPLVTNGERGSNGTVFLFTVMRALVERLLRDLAGELGAAQVEQHQVVVGAAGDRAGSRAA